MVPQSRPIPLLVTRPAAQGDRFAAEFAAHMPGVFHPIPTPLMEPAFLSPHFPALNWSSVILTSETGVEAALRLRQAGQALPLSAWCVGDRTARLAIQAGFDATSAQGDAEDLIALILASTDPGPLLHLRGRDARGDIAPRLTAMGRPAHAAVVYAQESLPLTSAAQAVLAGSDPVVVPLFSPRSAALFAAHGPFAAPLWIVAISAATARAVEHLAPQRISVAERPDGSRMLAAIRTLIDIPAS